MKVLITGGAGFIGTHTAAALTARGHEPVLFDSLAPVSHPPYPGARPPQLGPYRLLVGDVRDPAAVRAALPGVDVVCHLAALVGVGLGTSDLRDFADHNEVGTATVLSAMADAGVSRLVLASSIAVYGESLSRCPEHGAFREVARRAEQLAAGSFEPACPSCGTALELVALDETAEPLPRSMYGASKLAQEQQGRVWSILTGGATRSLRYHHVYGPLMARDTPYAGVASTFRSALEQARAPQVFEDGGQVRDFIHVSDVADATVTAIEHTALGGTATYNIASGQARTVGDFARELAAAMGGPAPVVTGEFRVDRPRHILASPERAAAELGWRAHVDFADGVAEFAQAPLRSAA